MKITPTPTPTPTPTSTLTPASISPRQQRGIAALISEPTVTKAAESCKIGQRTMQRWLADPNFDRAYKEARRSAFDVAIGLTQKYASLAVHTLAKILADASAPHAAKVSAASAMLKFAREALELDDLAQRVAELEARHGAEPAARRTV